MSNVSIFISHAHENKRLAEAWQLLLRTITSGTLDPWYSSDPRAEGGIGPGNWRGMIRERLESSNVIMALVTPGSNNRPWLVWESGFAAGAAKTVIPVTYFIKAQNVHSVFEADQYYNGESPESVAELCVRLLTLHHGVAVPTESSLGWKAFIELYLSAVEEEREDSYSRRLFQDHFHQKEKAEGLEGTWYACWTQAKDDGSEEVFESDSLHAWTTETRIRLVGASTKKGRELSEDIKTYPMEGVVSPLGWIALSYWSAASIPICGTCLMKPKGSSGELLEGSWQGFTAVDLAHDPSLFRGRVVMCRRREVVDNYWK